MEVEMKAGLAIAIVLGAVAPAEAQDMPAVSIPDVIVDEGDNARFDIVVTGGFWGSAEVAWRTEALSAGSHDFASRQGTITLTSGAQPEPIDIRTFGDHIVEGSEAFRLRLTRATSAGPVDVAVGYAVIRDGTAGRPRCDLDGDGHSDILVQYAVPHPDPQAPITHILGHDKWFPQSTIIQDRKSVRPSHWQIDAAGDFDGNGTCDFLWSWHIEPESEPCPNHPLGQDEVLITEADLVPENCEFLFRFTRPGTGWQVAGSDDTNADGVSDVLWWNPAARSLHLWSRLTDEVSEPVMTQVVGCMTDTWTPAGLGRLSAETFPDVLGYDGNGGLVDWAMTWTNGAFQCRAAGNLRVPVGETLAAVGDFDADGFDDLLLERPRPPRDPERQITAHFVRARDVVASSPLRYQDADISALDHPDYFAGPR
jgi:hypothetical protein